MTIDEAIAHAREIANKKMSEYENHYDKNAHYYPRQCKRCSEEYEQLAQWLEELQRLREEKSEFQIIARDNYEIGYNKGIDDFVKEICKMIVHSESNGNYRFYAVEIKQLIADLAEQLKAGVYDESSM